MRKRRYEEPEVRLGDVLEPDEKEQPWSDQYAPQDDVYAEEENPDAYVEEYSDEQEALDHEGRFHIAMGMFNLVSMLVGVLVILLLVAVLMTLFQWLRSDILHSALLLQSGLQ